MKKLLFVATLIVGCSADPINDPTISVIDEPTVEISGSLTSKTSDNAANDAPGFYWVEVEGVKHQLRENIDLEGLSYEDNDSKVVRFTQKYGTGQFIFRVFPNGLIYVTYSNERKGSSRILGRVFGWSDAFSVLNDHWYVTG